MCGEMKVELCKKLKSLIGGVKSTKVEILYKTKLLHSFDIDQNWKDKT